MPHYHLKMIPPRPTFAMDMTLEERALMQAHAVYVGKFFDSGEVLAYGPVLAPEGSFGIALAEFPDEAAVHAFLDGDPTIIARLMTCEISAMKIAASQPSKSARS